MKKSIAFLFCIGMVFMSVTGIMAQTLTPQSQMEPLTRGLVAIHKSSGGNFISWRLLGTDAEGTTFDLYRDGKVISKNLSATSYADGSGQTSSVYQVVTHREGMEDETSGEAQTWETIYKTMKLDRPTGGSFFYKKGYWGNNKPAADSTDYYNYYAHEASVADVDGDGEYEILVKWDPTNTHDNSNSGFTGNVYYDCYRMNYATGNEDLSGQKLWRIDLGKNIRAGSHYNQPMFFDFNGDGKAELICKTGPGSKDGLGRYITEAATDETIRNATDNETDYRNSSGHILTGPEYLTVFDGQTGKALHTIWYNPNRGFTTGKASAYGDWGDSYGNRGERFLAGVAYLDGPDGNPSAVMCRGYYTRAYLWAVDFDGTSLKQKWLHASVSKTRVNVYGPENTLVKSTTYNKNTSGVGDEYTAYGQGCHSLAVGDVDGDGCDEIMYGSAAVDNDGGLLYSTGLGHGDASHLSDFMPDRPGLEYMMPHEHAPYGWHVRDAATGELLLYHTSSEDNGRGMAAVTLANTRGGQFWSAANYNVYDIDDNVISTARPAYCFRIYWDGDPQDELLDGVAITKFNGTENTRLLSANGCIKNGSKAYPVLSADLFGDWREELVLCQADDSCTLRIYSTTEATKHVVPTLMHDHTYRMSICWQNVAYNQPPHVGYYMPDSVAARFVPVEGKKEQTVQLDDDMETVTCKWKNCTGASVYQTLLNGTRIKNYGVPTGFKFTKDATAQTWTLTGTPSEEGTYEFLIRATGSNDGVNIIDTIKVVVTSGGTFGDVNSDGVVNGTDIQAVINFIVIGEYDEKADVNKDEVVNGTDIQEIINIIISEE